MDDKLKVCIIGASGRMGQELIRSIYVDGNTELAGAVERAGSPHIGRSAAEWAGCGTGGATISEDLAGAASRSDVIIDFSGAAGTMANLENYRKAGKPLIIGSTGLSTAQLKEVKKLSQTIPLLVASNMSIGVNLLLKLVEKAAGVLDDQFDIEIFEAHHKHKIDAPSGTALSLGKAAAAGRQVDLEDKAVYCREGITGERKPGSIGFQVLRGGDIAGDHTVFFCGDGERIELSHRASSRQTFSKGALRAAKWLKGKPAGMYTIDEVLGL